MTQDAISGYPVATYKLRCVPLNGACNNATKVESPAVAYGVRLATVNGLTTYVSYR